MKIHPFRTLAIVAMAILLAVVALQTFGARGEGPRRFDLQQLAQSIKGGEVQKATWQGGTLEGVLIDGTRFVATVPQLSWPSSGSIQQMLQDGNVKMEIANPPITASLLAVIATIAFPLMIVATIYFLVLRPAVHNAGAGDSGRIAQLERALVQAHLEIQTLREALSAKTMEGLSS